MMLHQDIGNSIGERVAAARVKHGVCATIANTRDHETAYCVALHLVEVRAQVNNGADRLRNKKNSICESSLLHGREPSRESSRNDRTRELVVRERRVADVGGEK